MATLIGEKRLGASRTRATRGIPIVEDTFHFLVKADSINESRDSIFSTAGLPAAGITQRGLSVCRVISGVKWDDNPLYWDFTAEFSSEIEEGTQKANTDPTTWIPVYETRFERLQENNTKDKNGTAIANSAGQPFETGITTSRFIPIWTFVQFESAQVDDETIVERNETTNNAEFRGRAIDTLLCIVESSTLGFYYGQRRRLTVYSLKYNVRGWKHRRLDVGTVYKSGSTLLPYTDDSDNVILGGLNGSGGKVAAGVAPSILEFDMFESISFDFLRTA